MKYSVVLASLLVSCGSELPVHRLIPGHHVANQYLNEFMSECDKRQAEVAARCRYNLQQLDSIQEVETISGDGTTPDTIGVCRTYSTGGVTWSRRIEIEQEARLTLPESRYKAVIWHELFHCLGDLDHVNDPDALMAPSVASQEQIENHWEKMVDDAFDAVLAVKVGL